MARWHLTSAPAADRLAADMCARAGLKQSGEAVSPGSRVRTYSKRVVASENFLCRGESDWICVAGTLIMNGKLGKEALATCFATFIESGVAGVQSNALGHYAVAVKVGDNIQIFADPLGAFALYYCVSGKEWFVSNSLSLCAGAASSRCIDNTKLLIQALQTNLPGEETFYGDIRRLFGRQSISIGLKENTFRVDEIPAPQPAHDWSTLTIEEAVDRYLAEVRWAFRQLASVGRIGVFGTGGMDSRTVLSALLDRGADVNLMYGVGNSRLTDYHERDLQLAREVAGRCGIPFQQLDWSGTQPHSGEFLSDLFIKYGFRSEIYGAPQSFLSALDGGISPYPALMVGGYSPAFTNAKPWELRREVFPFDTLVDDTMHFQGGYVAESRCIQDKQNYRNLVAQGVRRALAIHGIEYDNQGANIKTFVKAKLLLYIRAEARYLNLVNEFSYYVAPFLMKRLYDPLIEIPLAYRTGDEFQLRVIRALMPDLMQVPLHSGIYAAHVDQAKLQLVRDTEPPPSMLKKLAKAVVPPSTRQAIKTTLRRAKGAATVHVDRNAAILQDYGRRVMQDPLGGTWFFSTAELSPKDLARICQYLAGVHHLGYTF